MFSDLGRRQTIPFLSVKYPYVSDQKGPSDSAKAREARSVATYEFLAGGGAMEAVDSALTRLLEDDMQKYGRALFHGVQCFNTDCCGSDSEEEIALAKNLRAIAEAQLNCGTNEISALVDNFLQTPFDFSS